jgi:hypothetical protein
MARHHTSYPYPVLGHEDDFKNGIFRIDEVEDFIISDKTKIKISILLESSYLQSLLKNNLAKIIVEVTCKETFLKQVFEGSNECEVRISSNDVNGKVQVKAWIISVSDIENYKPNDINGDYGDALFQIEKGDILAEAPGFWFIADKDFNTEHAPTASFIEIGQGSEEDGKTEVTYRGPGEKIIISLPIKDLKLYQNIAADPELKLIIHAAIVLPVLMQGIIGINTLDESSEYYNSRLFAVLRSRDLLPTDNDTDVNAFDIAQIILRDPKLGSYPISRALKGAYDELQLPPLGMDEDNE